MTGEDGLEDDALAERLFRAALAIRDRAHAPYSRFSVGAALVTGTGVIHAGCNVENASYPEGWCAETSAIAHMIGAGETSIHALLVVGPGPGIISPCGGCRQRIAEFASGDTIVYCATVNGIAARHTMRDLLPHAFDLTETGP